MNTTTFEAAAAILDSNPVPMDGRTIEPAEKESAGIGKGTPGPGRPKGVPNKSTRAAKEAIAFAAEGLGGAERLVAWAQEDPKNESAFWTSIYPKLLPLQVTGEGGGPLVISASPVDERL